jgi:hypothetical protein
METAVSFWQLSNAPDPIEVNAVDKITSIKILLE